MITAGLWLSLVVVLLAQTAYIASRARWRLVRVIVLFQVGYWFISYVGRGLLLIMFEPTPRVNDSLADSRMLTGGSYAESVAANTQIVAFGLLVFLVALTIGIRIMNSRPEPRIYPMVPLLVAASVYVIGWACRLLSLAGTGDNPVVSSLLLFGPLGVGLLLISPGPARSARSFWLLSASLFASEGLYGYLFASKTPFMATIALVLVASVLHGYRLPRLRVLVAAAVALLLFNFFQGTKLDRSDQQNLSRVDASYPDAVRPLLSALRRFDQFSAVTDARLFPKETWLSLGDYLLRIIHGFLPWMTPATWGPGSSAGVAWASELRSYSLPGSNRTVSLADGFIAEGYAWGAWVGVLTLAILMALLTLTVAAILSRRGVLSWSFGALLLAQPILFERGLQGAAEVTGQTVQAVAALAVIWVLIGRPVHQRRGAGIKL